MKSPCVNCCRVKDPQNCENKLCKDWQAWFIQRWEDMRRQLCVDAQQAPVREVGVPLGGNNYTPPHRVREFLKHSPCRSCIYPTDQCHSPCKTKLAWDDMQRKVCR